MHNWFSTLSLLSELKTMRILSIATVHSNSLSGCPLMFKKDLKKRGRGSFDYRTDFSTGTRLLKWFGNKCVAVVSSFAIVECTNTVEKYHLVQKKNVKIDCPNMVSQYNQSMDGVNLADMLIALSRTNIIKRKTWHFKLIFHYVDIAKFNVCLLYQRDCQQKEVSKKLQINLRTFTTQIDSAFTLACKDPKTTVARPIRNISLKPPVRRNPAAPSPVADIRFDKVAHWPGIDGNRSRWRKCNMTCTIECSKCKVGLCLKKDRTWQLFTCIFSFISS